jgi:hypothetical protein
VEWFLAGGRGSSRDLWVEITGEGRPDRGRWTTPSGLDVRRALGDGGPPAVDVPVWWTQASEHYGKRLTDLLWDTGSTGLKLVSHRLVEVLRGAGGEVTTYDVDVRWRRGGQVEGYVGMLEQVDEAGPVHSLWRGRRSRRFVVSDDVRRALLAAELVGLEVAPLPGSFPGDRPGFLED